MIFDEVKWQNIWHVKKDMENQLNKQMKNDLIKSA